MLIFIRNAAPLNDAYDGPISESEKKRAEKIGFLLTRSYGKPDFIFTSPFQQCTETAANMSNQPHTVNNDLARFIKTKEEQNKYILTVDGNKKNFLHRCKKVLRDYKHYIKEKKIVWIITHGQNLEGYAHYLKFDLPDKKPYLFSFSFTY
jgi:phosphohistidine phosphatase SixA